MIFRHPGGLRKLEDGQRCVDGNAKRAAFFVEPFCRQCRELNLATRRHFADFIPQSVWCMTLVSIKSMDICRFSQVETHPLIVILLDCLDRGNGLI